MQQASSQALGMACLILFPQQPYSVVGIITPNAGVQSVVVQMA